MSKQILFKEKGREKVKVGIDTLANAVRPTLGAAGRNVMIKGRYGYPIISNDGKFIADQVQLKDKFEDAGVSLLKQAADRTNDEAGDATTTTMVLGQAFIEAGAAAVAGGMNPNRVRRMMKAEADIVFEELKGMAIKAEDRETLVNVAAVSVENRELGEKLTDLVINVGKDGVVAVEESSDNEIVTEVIKGMRLARGYISKQYINNKAKSQVEYEGVPVFVTSKVINNEAELEPLINELAQLGKNKLLVIADDINPACIAGALHNIALNQFRVIYMKAPHLNEKMRDVLEDIAVVVGATCITDEMVDDLKRVKVQALGAVSKLVMRKDSTDLIGGLGEGLKVDERVNELKIQRSEIESELEKLRIEERISKLSGGVSVVRVGAASESEMKYLKHKVDDAVSAVKSAMEEGIVPGGGSTLLRIAFKNKDRLPILNVALGSPFTQILENAGHDHETRLTIVSSVLNGDTSFANPGYDVLEDKLVEDMVASGIVDPVKCTRLAVENAVSVAATYITTDSFIVEEDEE